MSEVAKKLLAGVAVTGVCLSMLSGLAFAAEAEEDKPTANLTVGAYSQYIWRGFELSKDSIVVQPSMTVAYKGFSANLWGNLDTNQYATTAADETNKWNETDMTLAYGWDMGPATFSVGYIYYALNPASDTQEFFASAALNTLLKPTLTVYRDFDAAPGWYTTLAISHSFPVKDDITLDLGAQVSYLKASSSSPYKEADGSNYSNFHDGVVSVGLTVPVNKYITVAPKLSYSFPLSNDAKDLLNSTSLDTFGKADNSFVYGGVSVSMAF